MALIFEVHKFTQDVITTKDRKYQICWIARVHGKYLENQ